MGRLLMRDRGPLRPAVWGKENDSDQRASGAFRTVAERLRKECREIAARLGSGTQFSDGIGEQFSAQREFLFTEAVCEESEIADALKAGWQGVHQETADELVGGEAHAP